MKVFQRVAHITILTTFFLLIWIVVRLVTPLWLFGEVTTLIDYTVLSLLIINTIVSVLIRGKGIEYAIVAAVAGVVMMLFAFTYDEDTESFNYRLQYFLNTDTLTINYQQGDTMTTIVVLSMLSVFVIAQIFQIRAAKKKSTS